ncbi:MAG: Nif3-like dinuclear metal center hexameric protein [Planctomycetota bacterium]
MVILSDIIRYIENKAGHKLYEDEGIKFGEVRKNTVKGITICWTVSPDAIRWAAERGHNIILCHEALTQPYPSFEKSKQRKYLAWPTNMQRIDLLVKNNITVCRVHFTMDELYIYKAFCEQIGAAKIIAENEESAFAKIYSIEQISYIDLIVRIKKLFKLNGIRATNGSPDKIIKTIGVAWGGLGLFVNVGYMESLIELGDIDVMICGETDNYGMRFCKEIGIDVIETSHEISENDGLRIFTKDLAAEFPTLDIKFFENKTIWSMY